MHSREEILGSVSQLLDIMDELRAKCPWDMKQTYETLRPLTIEEMYELADALLQKNEEEIKKELGDLLLHLVFYCKIGTENQTFDLFDVCTSICEKLIHRHPHIYGNVEVANEEEVKQNWEKLKLKEGKTSIFEGVPSGLPSMVKAIRLQEKAKGIGFEWPSSHGALEKIKEELAEFEFEINQQPKDKLKLEKEFGDMLFSIINASRYFDINADNALERTNLKFKNRLEFMEKKALTLSKSLHEMTLGEMDELWNESKNFSN